MVQEIPDLGVKIAENKEEKFWTDAIKRAEDSIFNCEKEIILSKHIIELAKVKLKPFSKV